MTVLPKQSYAPAIWDELAKINPKQSGEKFDQASYQEYTESEFVHAKKVATSYGFTLDENQVHIGGERFLMSGAKLVLTGQEIESEKKVIVKFSTHPSGIDEIVHEHETYTLMDSLDFAYQNIEHPEVLLFRKEKDHAILISRFIEQNVSLLARPLEEQFTLLTESLHGHESVHATTSRHAAIIKDVFGLTTTTRYSEIIILYQKWLGEYTDNTELIALCEKAVNFFQDNLESVDLYCDFLTHADFAPMNMRVTENKIYTIDQTSFHFGNKYESWARLINYLVLYGGEVANALNEYIRINKTPQEYRSLQAMRVYKLVYLLTFYASSTSRSTGDLQILSQERIAYWSQVLESVLDDVAFESSLTQAFTQKRDRLRSKAELERQKVLQQI